MLIRVMYQDGKFDMVKPELLNILLAEQRITSFKRSGAWAVVGRDPMRGPHQNSPSYIGPERRAIFERTEENYIQKVSV